jgi:mannan endo-1,4-beta-mannosidase
VIQILKIPFKMFVTKLAGLVSLLAGLAAAQTTTLQAESATLSGVTVATAVAGYSGKLLISDVI